MKYPNITVGEAIRKHKQGLEMTNDGQWLGTQKEWKPSLTEIYRNCISYDEYMEDVIENNYDREEADELWHELNFKYSH